MEKFVAIVKRNPALSHEEYRAGHAGHHMSHARRLRNHGGYVVNAWTDREFNAQVPGASFAEPAGFFDLWDGIIEVWFQGLEDYFVALNGEPDRAGPDGLTVDWEYGPAFAREVLFGEVPHQFAADERIVIPVRRPERYVTKLQQWAKRRPEITHEEFLDRWQHEYAPLYRELRGIWGYTITSRRDGVEAMRGFFPDEVADEAYSAEGTARRAAVYSPWDGYGCLWMDSIDDLVAFRAMHHTELTRVEQKLFGAIWYRDLDESVGPVPKRDGVPVVYTR